MQIVIDISEEVYEKAKEIHDVMCDSVWLGIKYGTPLPKGHGRLIDADALECDSFNRYFDDYAFNVLDNAPTIIEADKEVTQNANSD